jgi:FixJ family two-component response regulator
MLRNEQHSKDSHHRVQPTQTFCNPFEPQQARAASGSDFTVFLVDDDASALKALSSLLRSAGYRIETFSSSVEFLAHHHQSIPSCAIVDISMPDLDGLQLQSKLTARGTQIPIIFVTGCGNVLISVRAMKAGAVDFLTKPVREDDLLAAIARAERFDTETRQFRNELASIDSRLATLTQREHEVLTRVVGGRLNKQIAFELGIGEKTIKVHRSRMMRKMGVQTVAELVRLTERAASAHRRLLNPAVNARVGRFRLCRRSSRYRPRLPK